MASTVAGDAITNPVIQLMKDVIREEDDRQILHSDLRGMESLLQYTDIFFRYHQKDLPEMVKIWLQLLQNSLTEAKGLFHRSRPGQSCLDCVVCNPGRLSKEIRDWNVLFDHLYHGFQSDLIQHIALSGNTMISVAVDPVMELLKDVIKDEDNRQILQTDLRRMESLLLLQEFSTLIEPQKKALREIMLTLLPLLPLLVNSLIEAKSLLNSSAPRQSFLDRLSKEIREWTASFNKIYHDFHSLLSMSVTSLQFLSSFPLHIEEKAKEPAGLQPPLSRDEAWMLFRRVAFKEDQVSMDIEDRASKIAEQCRGLPLAINVVAAAMIGQRSLHEWDICLSSIQNVDPSFPATDSGLDAEMYAALRFSYDALPNSDVQKCFLYCALYQEDQEIDTLELVQMWIGEGVVKSKQGTYLMDMALGRKYLKLLVDRCLFQTVKERTNVFKQKTIRVQSVIRDMAIYIGQKEEKCLFMASKYQRNFSEVPDETCRRISLASNFNEDLPTQLRCPQLAILTLENNRYLKDLPSDFVLSVTSLRVLNLSGCTEISSVPTSIEELRMLEFLSLRGLPIEELPKQICRLSRLQFLDLSQCWRLKSLPSEIGEIQNLKCLNLEYCHSLEMIPREISELTSLSRLVLSSTYLSMEREAAASIWRLKGLKNMTELSVWMGVGQQVKDGIMGTWSEMRHLKLSYYALPIDEDLLPEDLLPEDLKSMKKLYLPEDLLPEDMKSMKKLQSFMLHHYPGYHCLPNCCKFEHLEMVSLEWCLNLTELSPLEWMPNLKLLKLKSCGGLRELGIGSRGGYQRLQKLVLRGLDKLESLGGASKTEGVWDERTLPNLRVLKIINCETLKRFPTGMEKLPNLCTLMGYSDWWESIRWEDNSMKIKLQSIFKEYNRHGR